MMALTTDKGKILKPGREYLVTVRVTALPDGGVAVQDLATGVPIRPFSGAEVNFVAESIRKA
jgi:hypothetical protein